MSRRKLTGKEVAAHILQQNNCSYISIEELKKSHLDNYNPRKRTLWLSKENYGGNSLASLGIAAHEAGHASQHKTGYTFFQMRNIIIPVVYLVSNLVLPFLIIGFVFSIPTLTNLGIFFFIGAVFFSFITLPVEFNASNRAMVELERGGFLDKDELRGTKKVLDAAALTYATAAALAVLQLIRFFVLREKK